MTAPFSPDGKRIVTASADKTARVWNASDLGQFVVLSGHEAPVGTEAFARPLCGHKPVLRGMTRVNAETTAFASWTPTAQTIQQRHPSSTYKALATTTAGLRFVRTARHNENDRCYRHPDMRSKRIRSILGKSLLFGAPLALSVQCDARDDDTVHTDELVVHIEPEAPFIDALNSCLADSDACVELCDLVLVEHGYTSYPGEAQIYECNVTHHASSFEVEISYDRYPLAVGCGVVVVDPESEPTSIGSHYAALAELEAASVYSFAQLARDLRHHGAPAALVRGAVRAAQDEARHTGYASMLAHAWGGTPRPARSGDLCDRDLFALSMENAVDGCVHETFGAAIAAHQAQSAADPFIRSTMASIARDEMRHARLAAEIDRWARARLSGGQAQALEDAARSAAAQLALSQQDVPAAVAELAGFPSADRAGALARALEVERRARWS